MYILQQFLYNFGISLYFFAIKIASLFSPKAEKWIAGREQEIPVINGRNIWFHCASLGEFEQARPLIEYFHQNHSEFKIIISFFSPSGYEVRKNYSKAHLVCYLPIDTKKNAEAFIEKINPELAFFIKYEFWIQHINALHRKKTPVFLVAGIFRKNQIFFKFYDQLFKSTLKKFSHLFVQNEHSVDLLESIGISSASIANDLRFDTVISNKVNSMTFPEIEAFLQNKKCIVIGSSWKKDELVWQNIIQENSEYKFIIAPHDVNENRISELQNTFPEISVLHSALTPDDSGKKVLIVDSIGKLTSIYAYAHIAYIGGGFGASIHNILEAAVYQTPVVFGPHYHKMQEAIDLINLNGALCIRNEAELKNALLKLQNPDLYAIAASAAGNYVMGNSGGTETVVKFLREKLFI
jgi:3-deoxy-D-manno-octulosonic-acid transferase